MRVPATIRWLGLALLGILIAAGVAFAASRLASQQIGLASEPISAGDALAPAMRQHSGPPGGQRPHRAPATTPTVTTPTTTTKPTPTTTETVAPEPQPEEPSHPGGGDGEHGGGHADD